MIDGETYHILPNENPTAAAPSGADTLHGGPDGWDWRNWTVVAHTSNSITFSLTDPDGDQGFPGEVVSYVTYTLGNMTWDFKMVAIATTKKTPIMLSSHVSASIPLISISYRLKIQIKENETDNDRHTGTSTASPTTKQPSP